MRRMLQKSGPLCPLLPLCSTQGAPPIEYASHRRWGWPCRAAVVSQSLLLGAAILKPCGLGAGLDVVCLEVVKRHHPRGAVAGTWRQPLAQHVLFVFAGGPIGMWGWGYGGVVPSPSL